MGYFLLVIAFGLLFAGIGIGMHMNNQKLLKICTRQTQGLVCDVVRDVSESGSGDDRSTSVMFYPVFQYEVDGRVVTKKSSIGTGRPRFSQGDAVTVFYNPDKVEQHYIKEDRSSSRAGIVFAAAGALIIVLALVLIPQFFG